MSGTKEGGQKGAATNKERHGEDFFKKIGSKGGLKTGVRKGFASNIKLAQKAGRLGGSISKRGKAL